MGRLKTPQIADEPDEIPLEDLRRMAVKKQADAKKQMLYMARERRFRGRVLPEHRIYGERSRQRSRWKRLVTKVMEEVQAKQPDKLISVDAAVLEHPNCGLRISKTAKSGVSSFPNKGRVPE